MKKILFALMFAVMTVACSSKVLVKKDSCKEVFEGALLECERVSK